MKKEIEIKTTLTVKVEMGADNVEVNGTGLRGYLPEGATYKEVVKVFGKPTLTFADFGKINVEWIGKINGAVFTIYDYKSDVKPQKNTDWHIGGKDKTVAALITAFFSASI